MTDNKSEVNDTLADLVVIGTREFSELSTDGSSGAAMRDKFEARPLEFPRNSNDSAVQKLMMK